MTINIELKTSMIAPCGMNCGLCRAYQRVKNKCAGCNSDSINKLPHCINCSIKNCESLSESGSKFCFACDSFPCIKIKNLDKRYKAKYGMSMIQNLDSVKKIGIRKFVDSEMIRWTCSACGNIICVHDEKCPVCGKERTIKEFPLHGDN